MRKTTIAVLSLCALAALAGRADEAEPADAKAEPKKLQGTWTVTKVLVGAKEAKPRAIMTWTFDGDKLVATTTGPAGGKGTSEVTESFKVKIDTKKVPHTVALVPDGGGVGMAGIYKVEKGELSLARLTGRGKAGRPLGAPKDFKGEGVAVYVMRREKGKGKDKE